MDYTTNYYFVDIGYNQFYKFLYQSSFYINLYNLSLLLSIISFIFIYIKSKSYKNKISHYKVDEEMSIIFIAHNIKTEKQLLILKEEIENELNKISESFSLHKKRIGRLFFYIFWIPTGF
ncbi:TPA: hypothetical protein ACSWPA_002607, partial [Staphylococcus aureus]